MIQFLKINELISEHKKASIDFDKYSRNIITELILPEKERTHSGTEFIHICKKEIDRIIEQSPNVPLHILNNLDNIIKSDFISNNNIKNILEKSYNEKSNKSSREKNLNKNEYSTLFSEDNIKENLQLLFNLDKKIFSKNIKENLKKNMKTNKDKDWKEYISS